MQVLFKQTQFMPSYPPLLLRNLSLVQRFLPNKWKTITTAYQQQDSQPPNPQQQDSLLQESLLDSLNLFISQNNLSNAFKVFSLLQLHLTCSCSSPLLLHPIASLLLSCTTLKAYPQGKQLHAQIIHLGFQKNPILVPKLVTLYTSFGHLVDAHTITEESNLLYTLPWNLLISAYVKNGLNGVAISTYKQMIGLGIKPDNFTYPSVLKACGDELDLGFGVEVHRLIETSGLEWSLFVQNALVAMYAKCGEVLFARKLFDKMPERDVVSWNSIISGYASKGMWKEAIELFDRMKFVGIKKNVVLWNTIAGGYVQTGNFKGALELISQMKRDGCDVDSIAIVIGLGACSRIGLIKLGKEIHGYGIRGCYDGVESIRNALIMMYSRCKDLRHSYIMFRSTEAKSVVTWNSMIASYANLGCSEEVSFILREMVNDGVEPNYVTIASVLPLCARVANLQHGKELHCYIIKRGVFENYLLLWNSLVDMYSKSGKVSEARRIFDSMSRKDEVTYTSLIAGYGMQGKGQVALQLFEEMNRLRIKPDHITMVAILSACSHAGMVSQGQILFEKMVNEYKIKPHLEHFACMVDLFGRAGLLRKAMEIITLMPFRPTPEMWATLLGACRIHGNTDIGEWAAEKLLEMRPQNSGYYVLIANMYGAARCWSKLAFVRKLMRDLGVRKAPGCAWVDIGDGFHPFIVGDTSSPLALEIFRLLYGLSRLMKDAGYVGNEDFVGLAIEGFEE